jgi:hypothetical protein
MNNLFSIICKVIYVYSLKFTIKQTIFWFKELTNHFLLYWSVPELCGRFSISTSTGPEDVEGITGTGDRTPQSFEQK